MKPNVGGIDRVARIVIGLTLVGCAATGVIGMWGWIGVLPILTGSIGVCPAYTPFGFSTCKMKAKSE